MTEASTIQVPYAAILGSIVNGQRNFLTVEEAAQCLAAIEHLRDCLSSGARECGELREAVASLIGLFDPYGRGRINEPESHCAEIIARASELLDANEKPTCIAGQSCVPCRMCASGRPEQCER